MCELLLHLFFSIQLDQHPHVGLFSQLQNIGPLKLIDFK